MTIEDHHAICDGCPRESPAITPITSESFESWARIEMQAGAEAHLCPRCQEKHKRGWLGEDFVLECVGGCGRKTVDNPT